MINKKIYISGPITGIENLNYEAFERAEKMLRLKYKTVVNPQKIHGGQTDLTWDEYIRTDIIELLGCDYIYLLPGFQNSKGSMIELYIAQVIGIKIINFSFLEENNLS